MRLFKIVFLSFFFLTEFNVVAKAQYYSQPQTAQPDDMRREHYFTFGFNLGMLGWSPTKTELVSGNDIFLRTLNRGIGVVGDVTGRKQISIGANTSIGLSAGLLFSEKKINSWTGIQLEFQNNKACYSFTPPFYFSAKNDTFSGWVMNDKYLKYSVAIQQCWKKNDNSILGGPSYFYVRESFGQTFYHRNFDQKLSVGHQEDWTQNGKGMRLTTIAASKTSYMLSSEIGIRSMTFDHDRTLDFGIVFYAPFKNSWTDQYEFFKQNVSTGKSNVTYKGSTVMLNLRYSFNTEIKTPPRDTVRPKEIFVVQPDTAGRKVEVQASVTANHKTIKVKVWDRDDVDGDSITLILNGKIIKEHISLKRRKKTFRIHLDPGANYLVMNAENLGSIPPNTAAVEVKDGHKKKRMELSSDMGKSGAIEIVRRQ